MSQKPTVDLYKEELQRLCRAVAKPGGNFTQQWNTCIAKAGVTCSDPLGEDLTWRQLWEVHSYLQSIVDEKYNRRKLFLEEIKVLCPEKNA